MSGLETLPPDQRAVLQLILVQGRGYADLAAMLQLDVAEVRDRAVAGIAALDVPGGGALDAGQRGRIADYLLGQQDVAERIVTFAELGESADACRWAQVLRERLAPIARATLPEVPAAAAPSPNGSAPAPVAATPAPPALAPALAAATPAQAATSRPSSRLGGAILLAGVAALVIVLAIVLFTGGSDNGSSSAASSTATQAQTTPQTTPSTQPTGTSTTPASAANIFGQVNLVATPAGGQAVGVGLVQRNGSTSIMALAAQKLPANGAQDIYAVWLQGSAGSRFLGYVPQQVKANGTFTVSAPVPSNVRSYATALVTRESSTATAAPTQPGPAILTGPLKFR